MLHYTVPMCDDRPGEYYKLCKTSGLVAVSTCGFILLSSEIENRFRSPSIEHINHPETFSTDHYCLLTAFLSRSLVLP